MVGVNYVSFGKFIANRRIKSQGSDRAIIHDLKLQPGAICF